MNNKIWNHLVAVAAGAAVTVLYLFVVLSSVFVKHLSEDVLYIYVPFFGMVQKQQF